MNELSKLLVALLALSPTLTPAAPSVERDELGLQILNSSRDPSYAEVAKVFPGMKFPREAVGVKDAPLECVVLPESKLMVGYVTMPLTNLMLAWFELAPGDSPASWHPFGDFAHPENKRLAGGYLPIVLSPALFDGVNYTQEVFGWSPDLNPDAALFTFVRLQLANTSPTVKTQSVRFQLQHHGKVKTAAEWQAVLRPGANKSFFLKMPLKDSLEQTVAVSERDWTRARKEVTQFWDGLLARGMQINVPEARVNDAWRAWMIYNFLAVDKINGIFQPHDGSGFYEEVYGYSAGLYCRMLDIMGHHRQAETYLASLRTFIAPDGLFTLNFGLPDTGVLLWAMSEHYRLTGDRDWLQQAAPDMIRMCDWIIKKRHEEMQKERKEDRWYGLIKFRPYCDDHVPAYSYFTDTYLCSGMSSAAEVLGQIGLTEQSERIGREARAYHADVLRSMQNSVLDHDGMKMLPIYPETHKLLKDNGFAGKDYYGLVACNLLETDFFAPNDAPARWLVDMLEQKGGLLLGLATFKGGIDHAYTYGYWMNALQRGEVKKVLLGFYGSLAYGMSRDTYSAVEVTQLREGKNEFTLPHLYSNTQQLSLLRNMLVYEQGDDLWLCPAIPRDWLADGKQLSVKNAATRFGETSFKIKSCGKRITVDVTPPTRNAPKRIELKLRHPGGEPIKSVKLSRGEFQLVNSDTVIIEGATKPFSVRAEF